MSLLVAYGIGTSAGMTAATLFCMAIFLHIFRRDRVAAPRSTLRLYFIVTEQQLQPRPAGVGHEVRRTCKAQGGAGITTSSMMAEVVAATEAVKFSPR